MLFTTFCSGYYYDIMTFFFFNCQGGLNGTILLQRLTVQEVGDLLELGDVVLTVAAVLLQQWEDTVVLATRVSGIQGLQLPEDDPPCGLLLLRVLHKWDRLTAVDGAGEDDGETKPKELLTVLHFLYGSHV